MTRRYARVGLGMAILWISMSVAPPAAHAAPKKEKKLDRIWTHPDFAGFGVDRIAMLPIASFDNNASAEKQVEGTLSQALKDAGYRWISASSTRFQLRDERAGDSLLNVVKGAVLKDSRVDSLAAPGLCARLRCQAILSVRVDLWEQHEIEWDQTGKPSTSVQLRAALVDSSGALLWSAAGSQTAEGPYRDAGGGYPMGLSGGSLQQKPVTGLGGAPAFAETVAPLFQRWVAGFPAKKPGTTP